MDQLIEVVEEYDEIEFLVSLDYNTNEEDIYSCSEWADLYTELGEYDNNPLILDTAFTNSSLPPPGPLASLVSGNFPA